MTTLKPDIDIIQNDNAKIKVLGVGGGGSNAVSVITTSVSSAPSMI